MDNPSILPLRPDTLPYYQSCFAAHGSPRTAARITWQFLQPSLHLGEVAILHDTTTDQAAAIYAAARAPMQVAGQAVGGAQSLDTLTDAAYRGRGLFVQLAHHVYAALAQQGTAVVYGFPNANSVHGFQSRLGWQLLGPVPFLLKPLRSRYFTSRIPGLGFMPDFPLPHRAFQGRPQYRLQQAAHFPAEADALWAQFSQRIGVAVIRDQSYLQWRFIAKPDTSYTIVHAYGRDAAYLGFVVFTVQEKHGGRIGYIMELLYDLAHPQAGQLLLQHAVAAIRQQQADCILSWCMAHAPNYQAYRQAGFFYLPERLRPVALHFGVRTFTDALRPTTHDRRQWYISYADSDTV